MFVKNNIDFSDSALSVPSEKRNYFCDKRAKQCGVSGYGNYFELLECSCKYLAQISSSWGKSNHRDNKKWKGTF